MKFMKRESNNLKEVNVMDLEWLLKSIILQPEKWVDEILLDSGVRSIHAANVVLTDEGLRLLEGHQKP